MAAHYGTAVLPTRPRRPRDKAKVEACVLIVERWLIGRLRDRRFYSLAELNAAIGELLKRLNEEGPIRRLGQAIAMPLRRSGRIPVLDPGLLIAQLKPSTNENKPYNTRHRRLQLTAYRDETPARFRPRGQVRFAAPSGPQE